MTENNAFIQSAARSMFKREVDESTLRLCRKLEWEIAAEEKRNKRLAELEAKATKQAATITDQAATITEQAATITEQVATIDQLRKEIAALKGQ